jgi:hypothetical protein
LPDEVSSEPSSALADGLGHEARRTDQLRPAHDHALGDPALGPVVRDDLVQEE